VKIVRCVAVHLELIIKDVKIILFIVGKIDLMKLSKFRKYQITNP